MRTVGQRIGFSVIVFMACECFPVPAVMADAPLQPRPNILWITSEDHGQQMGCYGDPLARTPNVDALATRGMLFRHAWSNAPVCAASRTTLITGMLAPSLGAEHMRSKVAMPAEIPMCPRLMSEAGYYCTNNSKEDYNLIQSGQVWDASSEKAHWRNRPRSQPFFSVFNIKDSHESKVIKRPHTLITNPAAIRVPAYHPDTPEVRHDWAQYYDQVSVADAGAGERLKELEAAGLAGDTIIFYFADHGAGMPRSKRWPSDSGLRVPMVVFFPEQWRHLAPKEYAPGAKSDRLVSFVDLAPTLLSLAGLQPPATMQGHAFAGPFQVRPQPFLYGFRGRMDERSDLVRCVTDGQFVYLRNFMPHRSQAQHVQTQFRTPTTRVWRRQFDEGLTDDAQSIFWREPKAPEELYDLRADPDETRNLVGVAAHRDVLDKLRLAQQSCAARIRDLGFLAEAEVEARCGDESPYDALATDAAYPFQRVYAAADGASLMQPEAVPQLRKYLHDSDSGVRYWGAMGALMRGRPAAHAMQGELRSSLLDPSDSVRIAAAETLVRYGDATDQSAGLAALKECAVAATPSGSVRIAAMNAIDALGTKGWPLVEFVREMPAAPNSLRSDYLERLRKHFLDNHQSNEEP